MAKFSAAISKLAPPLFLAFGLMRASTAGDLSKYRDFQFGTELATIAQQTGLSASQAKVIHNRPALIQELTWGPQPLGPSSKTEPVKEVVFSFYDGELFRITVNYDRYQTEGLTTSDMVDAISANFGIVTKLPAQAKPSAGRYGDQEEILARWQDPQYSFDLIRSSYGPVFTLVGVMKRLEATAQVAVLEAARLDEKEAPQREAERAAREAETDRANLEKARLANKPKFRP